MYGLLLTKTCRVCCCNAILAISIILVCSTTKATSLENDDDSCGGGKIRLEPVGGSVLDLQAEPHCNAAAAAAVISSSCHLPSSSSPATASKRIFFLETSGRDHLTPRQTCAVESAIGQGQLFAYVIMRSDVIDLDANNATRQLYVKHRRGIVSSLPATFHEATLHVVLPSFGNKYIIWLISSDSV